MPLRTKQTAKRLTCRFAILVLLVLAVAGYGRSRYGSLDVFANVFVGHTLVIRPAVIDLGRVPRGRDHIVRFRVDNIGATDRLIVGARLSCTCLSTDEMPLKIGAGAYREIGLRVKAATDATERFAVQTATFYTDDPKTPEIRVQIRYSCDNGPSAKRAVRHPQHPAVAMKHAQRTP